MVSLWFRPCRVSTSLCWKLDMPCWWSWIQRVFYLWKLGMMSLISRWLSWPWHAQIWWLWTIEENWAGNLAESWHWLFGQDCPQRGVCYALCVFKRLLCVTPWTLHDWPVSKLFFCFEYISMSFHLVDVGPRHVGDLFQVCLFALYHLKLARISPAIGFVLQCLSMVNQQQQYEWVATVKRSLEDSVQELQQKETKHSFKLQDRHTDKPFEFLPQNIFNGVFWKTFHHIHRCMPIPTHFGFLSPFAKLELEAQHHIAYN